MVFISSKLYHKKGDLAPLFGAKSSFFIAPFFHSPWLRKVTRCHPLSRLRRQHSTVRHSRLASLAGLACDAPCLTGLTSRCFAHSARASCAPLSPRGAFWIVVLPYEATLPKSLLFPEGKRGARRPPPVAETGRSKPSETGNIASALCARSEATMLNCGTVARRSRDGGIDTVAPREPVD